MIIGVPKEVKNQEYRVGMTPAGVTEVVASGHSVLVQAGAGAEVGYDDADYQHAGATILDNAQDIYNSANMIVKVKEIQSSEYQYLRDGLVIFHYVHLMPDLDHAQAVVDSGCVSIAYEMVSDAGGGLPLLAPMSEVAGRMAIQVGMHYLEKKNGGSGVLLSGVPGVAPAKVTVIGGGSVGENAVRMALGAGADVSVVNRSLNRLKQLDNLYGPQLKTCHSSQANIAELVKQSDLVVGAVLVKGEVSPKLVTRDMIKTMRKGSVVVDVGIDLGGCIETSRPTKHDDPIFVEEGVIHYCVPNMPGLVPYTATQALTNATLPFVLELAGKGWRDACMENHHLQDGLNCAHGHTTHPKIAEFMQRPHIPLQDII